jgi:hypothetical protein
LATLGQEEWARGGGGGGGDLLTLPFWPIVERSYQAKSLLALITDVSSATSRTVVCCAFRALSSSVGITLLASLASLALRRFALQAIADCLLGPSFVLLGGVI